MPDATADDERRKDCGDGRCIAAARVGLREYVLTQVIPILLRSHVGAFDRIPDLTREEGLNAGEDAICEYIVKVAARLADRAACELYPIGAERTRQERRPGEGDEPQP